MKIRLAKIHEAAPSRPPGYVEAVLARGVVDGEWLEISDEAMADLRAQYRPPSLPSVGVMAANVARSAVAELKARISGQPEVPADEIARRLAICQACANFIPGQNRCSLCGCYAALKARMRSQHCPESQW